jgi:hypothetical protein
MGVTVSYTAIPPTSNLHKRLQQENSLFVIAVDLWMKTTGLFSPSHDLFLSSEFRASDDDVLKDLVERYPKLFKSEMDVDIAIAELRWEIMETCKAHRGIEQRRQSLEKIFSQVEDYLTQELSRLQIPKPRETAADVMFGDSSFAPKSLKKYSTGVEPLGLITREAVQKGSAILRQVDLEAIEFQEDWHQEELQKWIDFYLAVEKNKEEILIIVL